MELCQLENMYISDLSAYNQVVNQRNKLLKDIFFNPGLRSTLDVWDVQLTEYGNRIISARRVFIDELNSIVKDIHKNLTGGLENIHILYEPDVEEDNFRERLASARERDLKMKTTTTGPHRDDMCVTVNGIDIRKYGSQGQQRTAALAIKLSEIFLVKKRIKDTPVLLLDDVLSELDSSRQNYLLDSIHDIQTIITCTGLDDFISHQFEINKVFHVVKGKVFDV
jgi:DNA replication and repair protein RecF